MQGARNGPWMDEDPVGPGQGVAGGPVGYKNGMRGEVWGLGRGRDVAKGKGTLRGGGCSGIGEKGPQAPSSRPVGLGNQPQWSGPTMGNLATGSREHTLNPGTALRCPQV